MDCGIPYCHQGCPVNNLIPDWNDLIYNNKWKEALDLLQSTNNFPEFTGRICPAPCEASCTLNITDNPVAIKTIECSIVDKGWEEGWIKPIISNKKTGKKVAVIGSGPSGLACAQQLARAGHSVVVFEKNSRIGGLLRIGIPDFKMEKHLIDRRMSQMEAEGVKFFPSVHVGFDIMLSDMAKEYDAVILSGGAEKPRDLPISGRDLTGIHFAMDFLPQQNKRVSYEEDNSSPILANNKHVIVIGGGDTGTDCIGTSLRHGCKSLINFEIMPEPPKERADNNPWPLFPRIYKVDYGHEESKEIYGDDPRVYSISGKEFLRNKDGTLRGIKTVEVDKNFQEIPGTEKEWEADLILLAMGFLGPEEYSVHNLDIQLDERSNYKAEHNVHQTSNPKVFAAGDCRRGQSLVVWAINEGRAAAREIDRHLMGSTTLK